MPAGRPLLLLKVMPVALKVVVVPAEASTPIEPLMLSANAKDDEAASTAPRARTFVKLFILPPKKPRERIKVLLTFNRSLAVPACPGMMPFLTVLSPTLEHCRVVHTEGLSLPPSCYLVEPNGLIIPQRKL